MLFLGRGIYDVLIEELFPKELCNCRTYICIHPQSDIYILAETRDLAWLRVYDNFMKSTQRYSQ